jgi:uncharacterized membrane protein
MKKINLVIVVIYFVLAVYYAIFNWSLFVTEFIVDVGFTDIRMPIVAVIIFIGLAFTVFQWVVAIVSDLTNAKRLTNKDEEMHLAKASFYDSNDNNLQKISDNIEQLFTRIDGISMQISTGKKNKMNSTPKLDIDSQESEML